MSSAADAALASHSRILSAIHELGFRLASLPSQVDVRDFAVDYLMSLAGVRAAWFSEYDDAASTLTIARIQVASGMLERALALIGRPAPDSVRAPVSAAMYRELVGHTAVGRRKSLTEISFGAVPKLVGDAAQALVGIDHFIGLSHVIEGELYGASVLAISNGAEDPPEALLTAFASLIAVSLRRRRAEQRLRESERRYRSLFDQSGDVVYLHDLHGRFLDLNPAALKLIGREPAETRSLGLDALLDPPQLEIALQASADLVRSGRPAQVREFRLRRKDGREVVIETRASVVDLGNGELAIQGVGRDLTERRALEAQLLQARKMEAIGTLAGGVAHDFNNILGGILGGLSLLELELSGQPLEEVREMKALVQRGADLARQLLGFARRGKYDPRPLDVAPVVAETSRMFGRTRREITFRHEFEAGLRRALVDHAQLEQVLLNLLLNAAQAMPGGGEITLRLENATLGREQAEPLAVAAGPYVKLVVADTGQGMDAATRSRIFEPFFSTKALGHGTGLGLASVYGIVQNHGGIISVDSEAGQGTAFTVLLPATDEPPVSPKPASEPPAHAGRGTVLLVDDEEEIRRVCSRLLERLGYAVLTAASGEEAVELVRTQGHRLALVILDLTMPGLGGAAAYDALREIAPGLKVLLSSGFAVEGQAHELLERGCAGFIQKPFGLAELSAKLDSLS